ncbi:Hypothetical Protein OBI_RACECAR_258 [Arthrobacter phage Racecar]|nr:hypothetical protein PBI_RACECAR_50 [Arthrobacter phage Racecar]QFG12734.1 hypothetical protein PBI_MIMI_50 [Arthrobacter phage Mimi]
MARIIEWVLYVALLCVLGLLAGLGIYVVLNDIIG